MSSKRNLFGLAVAGALVLGSLVVVSPAFADQGAVGRPNFGGHGQFGGGRGMGNFQDVKPAVVGKVNSVSGTTITVTSGDFAFGRSASSTATSAVYTVDASNATVFKGNATSSVSGIAVGDEVFVQGTVSGTNVTATSIRDGQMRGPGEGKMNPRGQSNGPIFAQISGNGQPVIAGTISAINGVVLSVNNKDNVSYTVDATNANVFQGNSTSTLASVKVGDTVVVQGTVNGNSVTASTVIDQAAQANKAKANHPAGGIFQKIGGFFMHLFGF